MINDPRLRPHKPIIGLLIGLLTIGGILSMTSGSQSSRHITEPEIRSDAVLLRHDQTALPASLRCPIFALEDQMIGGELPLSVRGDLRPDHTLEATYALITLTSSSKLEVKLSVQWSPKESVLRKWASYRLTGSASPILLKDITLDDIGIKGAGLQLAAKQCVIQAPYSYPFFFDGYFAGIEFPVATTRIEGDHLFITHSPGVTMQPGHWYESRKAVYGISARGDEWNAFVRYIDANHQKPKGLLVKYNHWWSTPIRANESDILKLMAIFDEKLYKPYGAWFDVFCIDLGWQKQKSVWQMDTGNFPDGFTNVQKAASKMKCAPAIWVSPSSSYPDAQDLQWAEEHGYEVMRIPSGDTFVRYACLAGKRYQAAFSGSIVDLITRYDVSAVKFDAYVPECPATDHGHAPGPLSSEAMAQGLVDTFIAARKAKPDVWLRPTCFWYNPSPWWMFYVNSVTGTYGADAPYGRVPSPVYRESYTSARDYFNLQGETHLPIPISAQEVLGITHQSPEPFMNDAVVTVTRGGLYLPLYLNPVFMDGRRWEQLADVLNWTRRNAPILRNTEPIIPTSWQDGKVPSLIWGASMPREPYGYAHWKGSKGIVTLRNPWIAPQTYSLRIGPAGVSSGNTARLSAVSLYPEPRVYGTNLKPGDTLDVHLAPYETLLLSIGPRQRISGLPDFRHESTRYIEIAITNLELGRVEFDGNDQVMGSDWTSITGEAHFGLKINLDADVTTTAPRSELLILVEDKETPIDPICRVRIDGKDVELTSCGSQTGWAADDPVKPERWLFLRAPIKQGKSKVSIEMLTRGGAPTVSAWVWGVRDGSHVKPDYPNALPSPETIYLDAANLLSATTAESARDDGHIKRPIERIDGVFVDALEISLVTHESGGLIRNRNIADKPMSIAQRRYFRGLGTFAPTRITLRSDGMYRRFQSWVGTDSGIEGWDRSVIVFEVWADGKKLWESAPMDRGDNPKWVDIDIDGAKTLELVTRNIGTGDPAYNANWADWAEARLLR